MVSTLLNQLNEVPISALQHWAYCPRQYALIHLERQWRENMYTAKGRVLHNAAHSGKKEMRQGTRILRGVELRSYQYGLYGVADIVEITKNMPYPVEYKRGGIKMHKADDVQLCAQALCLEEMMDCKVEEGAIYYGKMKRRTRVQMTSELRAKTIQVIRDIQQCMVKMKLPKPEYNGARCDRCSLYEVCRPKLGVKRAGVERWLAKMATAKGVPE